MTNRQSGSLSTSTRQWVGFGGEATEPPTPYYSSDNRWSTTGGETPSFKKMQGDSVILPRQSFYTAKVTSFQASGGGTITKVGVSPPRGWTSSGPHSVNDFSRSVIDFSEVQSLFDDSDFNRAVISSSEALMRSGWDALTFAGEFRETIAMLVGLKGRLIAGMRNAKKARTWEEAWMEYRYGWRPLYLDMLTIQKALEKKETFQVYKKRSSFTKSRVLTSTYSVGSGSATHHYQRQLIVDLQYVGNSYSALQPERVHTDVLPAAWELLTLSFVVDWFVNIGSVLAALSGSFRTPDLLCSAGVQASIQLHVMQTGWTNNAGWTCSGSNYVSQSTGYLRKRIPWTPQYVPTVRLNFSLVKLLDLTLILKGRFKVGYR